MDDAGFNAIFIEDMDNDYENIMDRFVDHINSRDDYNNGASSGDVDNGANDDDDDDSDEDGKSFWRREFDRKKLIVCTAGAIHMYYITFI